MRFSLRWMFMATTCLACLTMALALGQRGSLIGFWLSLVATILIAQLQWQPRSGREN